MNNILFVTRTMDLGGTEKVILQLCKSFKSFFDNIYVCSSGGSNLEILNDYGITHFTIPDFSNTSLFGLLKIKRTIKKIVKNYNISIIHTHHRMAAFLCRNIKKVSLLNNVHNTFFDKYFLTRKSLMNYMNIAVGKTVYDNLTNYYRIPSNKVLLIENSVPLDDLVEADEKTGIFSHNNGSEHKKIVFIGRLEQQKGIDLLMKAIPKVKSNVYFYIYGEGSMKELVVDSPCEKVVYKGYTNNPLQVIRNFDYTILPSRWEGLPLIIIESMAVGVPTICSDISSNKEIVSNEENGFLFECDNLESLISTIDYACAYKELEKLKNNCKKTYNDRFSYELFVQKYKEVYSLYKK